MADVGNDPDYLTALDSTRSEIIIPVFRDARCAEIIGTILDACVLTLVPQDPVLFDETIGKSSVPESKSDRQRFGQSCGSHAVGSSPPDAAEGPRRTTRATRRPAFRR